LSVSAGRSAIVVGAGIGGLAAGTALRGAGWEVAVLERAPELRPLGAGLSIWPNGVVALRSLGAGAVCDSPEVPRSDGALRRVDGGELAGFDPVEIERRFGAPLVGVHRGDLQEALLAAFGSPPRTGAEVESVGPASVHLAGGEELEADLIVGADGLRSTVREWAIGAEEPVDSGIVAWRGVATGTGGVPAGEWWGAGCVAGLLPRSGDRTYWYVAYRGREGDDAGFGAPVRDAVAATERGARLSHRLFDRPPAGRWSRGRVTLLGDAAHPMLPFLGQGACSALEDAVALAAALDGTSEVETALAAYEDARRPRTAGLIKGSRQAARIALLGAAPLRALRNLAVAHTPMALRMRQIERVVGG
jgi:2-polyprenyl-6-methoxyphenol hydroxylase-like FAD-dependent oxidoreductase